MPHPAGHLTDEQLLLDLDGEFSAASAKPVHAHLAECWQCRARRQEIEKAITGFVRAWQQESGTPSIDGPRALLRARLEELRAKESRRSHGISFGRGFAWSLAAAALFCMALLFTRVALRLRPSAHAAAWTGPVPDSRLTPGATLLLSRRSVCSANYANNKPVPAAMQRKVFEAYGIPGAEPREYEVDYLVTPALGGADDIRNLWPEPYTATVWSAPVKDALEDRLRNLVCDGDLDLTEAQQEIATNWIVAYKKYFHTDLPLSEHYRHTEKP